MIVSKHFRVYGGNKPHLRVVHGMRSVPFVRERARLNLYRKCAFESGGNIFVAHLDFFGGGEKIFYA